MSPIISGGGGGGGAPSGAAGGDLAGTYPNPTVGNVSILTTKGDVLWESANGTAARLAVGAQGQAVQVGAASALVYAYPPGYEIGYDALTSTVNVTSTTEATGDAVISCAAHTFDGGAVICEVFFPSYDLPGGINFFTTISLFEGATQIGRLGFLWNEAVQVGAGTFTGKIRFTPSAASHTYTVTAFNSAVGTTHLTGGTPGTGAYVNAYCRFTKV